jgi:hypothetical protein
VNQPYLLPDSTHIFLHPVILPSLAAPPPCSPLHGPLLAPLATPHPHRLRLPHRRRRSLPWRPRPAPPRWPPPPSPLRRPQPASGMCYLSYQECDGDDPAKNILVLFLSIFSPAIRDVKSECSDQLVTQTYFASIGKAQIK